MSPAANYANDNTLRPVRNLALPVLGMVALAPVRVGGAASLMSCGDHGPRITLRTLPPSSGKLFVHTGWMPAPVRVPSVDRLA